MVKKNRVRSIIHNFSIRRSIVVVTSIVVVIGLVVIIGIILLHIHFFRYGPYVFTIPYVHTPQISPQNCITCFTNCLLGNVMCQIATIYALAQQYNMKPTFPSLVQDQIFNIGGYYSPVIHRVGLLPTLHYKNAKYRDTIFHRIPMHDFVPEKIYVHDTIFTVFNMHPFPNYLGKYRNGLRIDGGLLSFRYFEHLRPFFQTLFEMPLSMRHELLSRYHFASYDATISVHIRRGDLLNPWNPTIVLGRVYYEYAIRLVLQHIYKFYMTTTKRTVPKIQIIICSDDSDHVQKNWSQDYYSYALPSHIHLTFSKEKSDLNDLYVMSLCDHHIIGTSTFSAWSAFLGKTNNNNRYRKMIICPEKIHSFQHKTWCSLFPKSWTHIPVE